MQPILARKFTTLRLLTGPFDKAGRPLHCRTMRTLLEMRGNLCQMRSAHIPAFKYFGQVRGLERRLTAKEPLLD